MSQNTNEVTIQHVIQAVRESIHFLKPCSHGKIEITIRKQDGKFYEVETVPTVKRRLTQVDKCTQ